MSLKWTDCSVPIAHHTGQITTKHTRTSVAKTYLNAIRIAGFLPREPEHTSKRLRGRSSLSTIRRLERVGDGGEPDRRATVASMRRNY